jgi:PKD repeat protein
VTVSPAGSVVAEVAYTPGDVGPDTGSIVVTSNDADEPEATVALAGAGVGTPDIAVEPAAIDFGPVFVGSTQARTVRIVNEGTGALDVTSIALGTGTSPDIVLIAGFAGVLLPPGGEVTVSIEYTPGELAADSGALVLTSDDPDEPTVTVAITGSGTDNQPPAAPSSPSPPDGAADQPTTVTLGWSGGDPDAADTVTHDVYLGVSAPPPLVASGLAQPTFVADSLTKETLYSWIVVATDNRGASTAGPVWTFRTASNQAPAASPSGDRNAGNAPVTVVFTSNAADADGSVVSWQWDFGDGATSTEADPSHEFTEVGSYAVTLTVEDNEGAQTVATVAVTVVDPATTILAAGTLGPAGGTVQVAEGDLAGASVTVPPDVLTEDTAIVIGRVENPPPFEPAE